MKKTILLIGASAIILNILLWMVIPQYVLFPMLLNTAVIFLTAMMILSVHSLALKDGFKVSLTALFSFGGAIAFICGFFSISQFGNNWVIILDIALAFLAIILLIISSSISKKTD